MTDRSPCKTRLAPEARPTHRSGNRKQADNTMISMPRTLLTGAVLGILAVAAPAMAQTSNSNVSFDPGALAVKKPRPGLPDVKPNPLAWPRLDPGAVLCRTKDDLAKLTARRSGETVTGTIDCQIVRVATAISILQREGLGRVEVQISGAGSNGVSGWTDAWLPDKAPGGATSARP
jgi:hypothetical protein